MDSDKKQQNASTLSTTAVSGFAQSVSYDQHRPSCSDEVVDRLLAALGVGGVHAAKLLELAAGTGKFTDSLAGRPEHYDIVAVEPHSAMRDVLLRKSLANVTVLDGLSTSIPAAADQFDAVIVAQAFHWFANRESLRELHRVLKPGRCLGLVWNIEDSKPSTAWEAKLKDVIWSFDDEEPRFRHDRWQDVFSITSSASPLFSLPLGRDEVKWTVWLPDKEALWSRFRTLSQIAVLEGQELQTVRSIFDKALNGDDVETNEKGKIALHGITYLVWTSKVP